MIRSRPASTPSSKPAMKPPPMKRLTIAVGNITNAASTLNPRRSMTTAPTRTRPSIIPSMKAKLPRNATHGTNPTHIAKKPGERRATAFAMISPAEINSKATATHRDLKNENWCGNGPYITPPGGTAAGGSTAVCAIAGAIGLGTVVW